MRQFRVAGLVVIAVCVLGVIVAGAASAASTVLPEFSNAVAGSATSGASSLNLEGTRITCPLGETVTSPTSTKLGTFRILFDECQSGDGEPCHSLGQASGSLTIEVTGEYHLVSRASDRTFYMIWFLLAPTDNANALHLECEDPEIGLLLVWGNVLGQIGAEPGHSERTFGITVKLEGGGKTIKQVLSTYGNNNGTEVTAEGLKGKIGTGPERTAGETAEKNLMFTTSATSLKES